MRRLLACTWLAMSALASAACSGSAESDTESDDDAGAGETADGGKGSGGSGTRAGAAGKGHPSGKSGAGTGAGTGSGGQLAAGGSGTGGSGRGGSGNGGAALAGSGGSGGGMAGGEQAGGAGEPSAPAQGQCVAPCELALGPADNLPGDSAVLVYDFETDTATVTSDPAVNAASDWVIGFSYEADPEHGYGSWSTGGWWFAFTEPLEYVEGTYSMRQDVEITSQMVNPLTDQILRVVYSFGDRTVRVHSAVVPDCDAATAGACASPADCKLVEEGMLRATAASCSGTCGGAADCVSGCVAEAESVSLGCSGCYADFLACVSAACPTECPGSGGNDCMTCETDAACHATFMACSGLDYMPRGTLTWPLPQPVR